MSFIIQICTTDALIFYNKYVQNEKYYGQIVKQKNNTLHLFSFFFLGNTFSQNKYRVLF